MFYWQFFYLGIYETQILQGSNLAYRDYLQTIHIIHFSILQLPKHLCGSGVKEDFLVLHTRPFPSRYHFLLVKKMCDVFSTNCLIWFFDSLESKKHTSHCAMAFFGAESSTLTQVYGGEPTLRHLNNSVPNIGLFLLKKAPAPFSIVLYIKFFYMTNGRDENSTQPRIETLILTLPCPISDVGDLSHTTLQVCWKQFQVSQIFCINMRLEWVHCRGFFFEWTVLGLVMKTSLFYFTVNVVSLSRHFVQCFSNKRSPSDSERASKYPLAADTTR